MKDFKTYDELITLLTDEKNLIIDDVEYAKHLLKKYSYFNLVNGYKQPFKNRDGTYKKNTHFYDIYCLYEFDEELRNLLMKYILIIELHMKSLISYSFCEKYGASQAEYLNCLNYNYTSPKLQSKVNEFIQIINEILNSNNKPIYLKHQAKNNNIPLWALVKILTIGNISKMYSIQNPSIQSKISHEFPEINEGSLIYMLDILTRFRNVCAHNERLYDFRYHKCPVPKTKTSSYFFKSTKPVKSNLFGVIIILKYLLEEKEFSDFMDEFSIIFDSLFKKTGQIQKAQLLALMGFPKNWEDIKELKIK